MGFRLGTATNCDPGVGVIRNQGAGVTRIPGSDKSATKSAKKNFQSAVEHPSIVDDYLQKELSLGTINLPRAHINRFGVIPKMHQQDK